MPSIIIPAHNEESVIRRCVQRLAAELSADYQIIVIANGCTDNTAEIAREYTRIQVEELKVGSKAAALRFADRLGSSWPRIYLDADVVISAATVQKLTSSLEESGFLAARAPAVVNVSGAPILIRAYYRARSRLPSIQRALWGAGCYVLTRDGHARVAPFPQVIADDLWIDQNIPEEERLFVANCEPIVIRGPVTYGGFFAITSRSLRGNRELGSRTMRKTFADLLRTTQPGLAVLDSLAFVLLTIAARARAAGRVSDGRWERDESSRASGT